MASKFARGFWLRKLMLLALCVLRPTPAFAHKLYVFALVKGTTIAGRAYFPGDVPAANADVIVRDPAGKVLGRSKTDEKGEFTYTPRERVDHNLSAETLDGHEGRYTVHAPELPGGLPGDSPTSAGGAQAGSPAMSRSDAPDVPAANVSEQLAELTRQIGELRRQVFDADERLRFRDILGGIGFILGLAGVAYYMKARGKKS
jgi:nickel transport protein